MKQVSAEVLNLDVQKLIEMLNAACAKSGWPTTNIG